MKRTAILLAVLLIVPFIAFGNEQTAHPRTRTNPIIEAQKLPGISAGVEETADLRTEAPGTVKTIKISDNRTGNKRFPGVGENVNGDRLVIYRGANRLYWYSFARNEAAWSVPKVIPDQPQLESYTCTDVEADSTGRFHCVWEEPDAANVYASFLDGQWTKPHKLDLAGKYDMESSIAVRSDDQIIIANGQRVQSPYLTKDIFFYVKGKDDSEFTRTNVTKDKEGSCQPAIVADANDHIWMTLKSEIVTENNETLDIFLVHYDQNNEYVEYKILSNQDGWCFWPQIAINSDGKIMGAWAKSQSGDYFSRIYDPGKKALGEIKSVNLGLPLQPWCTFWSKLAAHGKDFYLAAMNSARVVYLMKYSEEAGQWTRVTQVSDGPVNYLDIYPGYNKILIAWDNYQDPSNVYLTTVAVTPAGPRLHKISGKVQEDSVGLSGVTMTGLPEDPTTDSSGNYSTDVENGWTGTVIPNKSGYRFLPSSREYVNVTSLQAGQDYTAIKQFNLTITATSGGTTTPPPATYHKDLNSLVTVTAIPDSNYRFSKWTGDASGSRNPIALTIDRDKTIRANFIRIKSVANLKVQKRVERGFFNGYTLNALTWEVNPENAEMGLTVSAQRVYRKARAEGNTKWARIVELASTVLKYEDRHVPPDSDYVYAVVNVDDKGNESAIY